MVVDIARNTGKLQISECISNMIYCRRRIYRSVGVVNLEWNAGTLEKFQHHIAVFSAGVSTDQRFPIVV